MKKLRSNVPVVEALYARLEKFLAATGPELERMSSYDIREMVNELKAHLLKLESQDSMW